MGNEYQRLEAAYRAGQIGRRTFMRRLAALGVVSPLLLLPFAAAIVDAAPEASDDQEPSLRPSEPPEPTDPPEPGGEPRVDLVSPLAGATAGGYTVTIQGANFQPGAAVYFGNAAASDMTYLSPTRLRATVPAANASGSVTVSVTNPDGLSSTLPGGFTYMDVNQTEAAQVLGITPLSIIEDTETQIVVRGRNLVRAYTEGFVGLRGPAQAQITVGTITTSSDEETKTEALTITVRVTSMQALEPQERMTIQVLASTRPGAGNDLVVESSRQMFTVLPRAVPVPLAYTAKVGMGEHGLVVVAGRNLKGCMLEIAGTTIHLQQSEETLVAAVVSMPVGEKARSGDVRLVSFDGSEVGRYAFAFDASAKPPAPPPNENEEFAPLGGALELELMPVPDQRFISPTSKDSMVVQLSGGAANVLSIPFNWANFEITIIDITIILPLLNEVRMVPFFDGGGAIIRSPIAAKVGKLLRLRGMGLLLALRIEIIIHVEVVLIIGFIYEIWPYGLYNEFYGSYGWAIGSIVIGIRIEITIIFNLMWMAALVLPNGQLRVLSGGTLQLGIDFTIGTNGRDLYFDPDFIYRPNFFGIGPLAGQSPCGDQFQLVEDGGQTVFGDGFGAQQSFYFPRAAGGCCLPWDFNMQLVRFASNQPETVVQDRFRASYCLQADPSPNLSNVYITSLPPPTGTPPELDMQLGDSATLKVMAQPVDEAGNPTGAAQDIRELGYGVEFYIKDPPFVLSAEQLPDGTAIAESVGRNIINAAVTSVRIEDDEDVLAFWPGGVFGFEFLRFAATENTPRINPRGLPVDVAALQGTIELEPVLAYIDANNQPVAVPWDQARSLWELERVEPWETPRDYVLALRVTNPEQVQAPQTVQFTVQDVTLLVLRDRQAVAENPLAKIVQYEDRHLRNAVGFFFSGTLAQPNASGTITIEPKQDPDQLLVVGNLVVHPHHIETRRAGRLNRLVPPGKGPRNREVKLRARIKVEVVSGEATVSPRRFDLGGVVKNEETFEEYVRVLEPINKVLAGADLGSLKSFPQTFYGALVRSGPTTAMLNEQGRALWNSAYTIAQTTNKDDRPLYYARLQAISAMRAYAKRTNMASLPDALIKAFEWPSRGFEPDGTIRFENRPTGERQALVTGFDPYGALFTDLFDPNTDSNQYAPDLGNPSGMIALAFNTTTQGNNAAAFVRSVIFPVRYAEFNAGLVETAVESVIGSVVLLLTTSQNGSDPYYDIDKFASRYRNIDLFDNNNERAGIGGPIGDGYLQTTLPFRQMVTGRMLPGPTPDPINQMPFVINQAYKGAGVTDRSIRRSAPAAQRQVIVGRFRPRPLQNEEAAYKEQPDSPDSTYGPDEGSGSNFLSNEIFYRATKVRVSRRPSLTSGHFHIPKISTATEPWTRLVSGVTEALGLFLAWSFPLGRSQVPSFGRTRINTTSAAKSGVIKNELATPVTIATFEASAPFAITAAPALPKVLAPGEEISLSYTFSPTAVGNVDGLVFAKDGAGTTLHAVELNGEGALPTPTITSFSPAAGREGTTVTVRGENLDVATELRIGGEPLALEIVDATMVRADITDTVNTGYIEIDTPFGTARSATVFRVIRRPPPHDPDR